VKGSPLVRAFAAFLLLALLGLPLWRLTHAREASAPPSEPERAAVRDVTIALTFTSRPMSLRVRHLGRELWTDTPPALESQKTVRIPYPKEGVDLQFEAKFPDEAPLAAIRVRLTDPAGETHERSVWGRGEINEVLTFP
jgi:uncharacterized protein (DUF58 family)